MGPGWSFPVTPKGMHIQQVRCDLNQADAGSGSIAVLSLRNMDIYGELIFQHICCTSFISPKPLWNLQWYWMARGDYFKSIAWEWFQYERCKYMHRRQYWFGKTLTQIAQNEKYAQYIPRNMRRGRALGDLFHFGTDRFYSYFAGLPFALGWTYDWLHRYLSFTRFTVQQVTKISSKRLRTAPGSLKTLNPPVGRGSN